MSEQRPKLQMQRSNTTNLSKSVRSSQLKAGIIERLEPETVPENFCPWVPSSGKTHKTISTDDVCIKHGIPETIFIKHIAQELNEQASCLSLPFTLLFVFSFAFMAILHNSASIVNAVEDAIEHDIIENANFAFSDPLVMGHKGFEDVNNIADFWSFLRLGLMPLIFTQEHFWAEGLNFSDPVMRLASEQVKTNPLAWNRGKRAFYLNYNKMIFGVRMQQERPNEALSCSASNVLQAFYGVGCDNSLGYELDPEMDVARVTTNPQRTVWFDSHGDIQGHIDYLGELERSLWLDIHTKKIEIAFAIYNGEYDLYTFSYVNFFFSRGGHIWKKIITVSMFANHYQGWHMYVVDSIWLSCIIYILIIESIEVVSVMRKDGLIGVMTEYWSFWNAVDWVSVVLGIVIFLAWLGICMDTEKVNDLLGTVEAAHAGVEGINATVASSQDMQKFLKELEAVMDARYKLNLMIAFYPVIIMMRLFKAFSAQARLGIVTQTIAKSFSDLMHFLVVFIAIFGTYSVMGVLLFGQSCTQYSKLDRAVNACFRLMLGDIDWEEISKVGRVYAGIWFWSFEIIISVIMLNMLLAIIMDAYSVVKGETGDAETIVDETKQVWARWRARAGQHACGIQMVHDYVKADMERRGIKLRGEASMLQKTVMKMNSNDDDQEPETMVTIEHLMQIVPNIGEFEAHELIHGTILDYLKTGDGPSHTCTVGDVLLAVQKINYRTKKAQRILKHAVAPAVTGETGTSPGESQSITTLGLSGMDRENGAKAQEAASSLRNIESTLSSLVMNVNEQSRRIDDIDARLKSESRHREEVNSKLMHVLNLLEAQSKSQEVAVAKHKSITEPAVLLPTQTGVSAVPPRWGGCCTSVSRQLQAPS